MGGATFVSLLGIILPVHLTVINYKIFENHDCYLVRVVEKSTELFPIILDTRQDHYAESSKINISPDVPNGVPRPTERENWEEASARKHSKVKSFPGNSEYATTFRITDGGFRTYIGLATARAAIRRGKTSMNAGAVHQDLSSG